MNALSPEAAPPLEAPPSLPPEVPEALVRLVAAFWRRFGPSSAAGAIWRVGVSGGLDSCVLTHLAATLARQTGSCLEGVHLQHGLRGAEADGDLRQAERVCQEACIAFRPFWTDTRALSRRWKAGLEETGRLARRAVWTRLAEADAAAGRPPPWVWLAHHADDQAETVLMRMRRGAANRGRAGLRPVRPFGPWPTGRILLPGDLSDQAPAGSCMSSPPPSSAGTGLFPPPGARPPAFGEIRYWCARPLLDAPKKALADYARRHGLSWREDASNTDLRFARNRLRHRRIPELERRSPDLRRRLGAMAQAALLREDREMALATAWLERAEWRGQEAGAGGRLAFGLAQPGEPCALALPLSPSIRRVALREFLERATGRLLPRRTLLLALDKLSMEGRPGRRLSLPGGWEARRTREGLSIVRADTPPAVAVFSTDPGHAGTRLARPACGGGEWTVPGWGTLRVRLAPWPGPATAPETASAASAWMAAEAPRWPLSLRPRGPGDIFRPLGGPGRRKVKDFLIDRRLSQGAKARVRLLADALGVLWVAPIRLDERARVACPGDLAWEFMYFPSIAEEDPSCVQGSRP